MLPCLNSPNKTGGEFYFSTWVMMKQSWDVNVL